MATLHELKSLGVLVDGEDSQKLAPYSWHIGKPDGKKAYAFTTFEGETVYMHRAILDAPRDMEVDHINGNGLDNRRSNLRLATRQQNCVNRPPAPNKTSRFKGVSWCRKTNKWVAVIHTDRKKTTLGYFIDERAAAHAYNQEAASRFGEFAYLNDLTT